jgi:hypothetical protein
MMIEDLALALRSLLLVAALGGCTAGEPATTWTERDSAGIRIVENAAPLETWSIPDEPTLSLGATSEEGPTQFFQIRGIAFLPGDRFVVANAGTEQLRIFDASGTFVAEVGGKGNGPDEYSALAHVWLLGDSILAYDFRNDRISVRDISGTLARTFRLEWFSGGLMPETILRDGTVATITGRRMTELPGTGLILDSALISRYDVTGALIDSLGRLPHNQRVTFSNGNMNTTLGLPFSVNGRLAPSRDGYCYAFGTRFEIRCFSYAGSATLLIQNAVAPRPIGPSDIEWFWENALADANPVAAAATRKNREQMIFPDTFPAFADLLADDQGRAWAQLYPLPDATDREWQVFEDGRWIARLTVPPGFQLMAVSGDRLIGVWRDELGVESVRLYHVEGS